MTLDDSTELARNGTRKFHTCPAELGGAKILIPPTVAPELASDGLPAPQGALGARRLDAIGRSSMTGPQPAHR